MQTRAPRLEPVWPRGSCIFLCALVLFVADKVKPALLHGDLWVGNTGAITGTGPIVFDPACFFGHSEYDLAIMSIFGGFSREFFEAYHHLIPRAPGFENREKVYRLYHLFNQVPICIIKCLCVHVCVRASMRRWCASLFCVSAYHSLAGYFKIVPRKKPWERKRELLTRADPSSICSGTLPCGRRASSS